jgi:hypothetical protein
MSSLTSAVNDVDADVVSKTVTTDDGVTIKREMKIKYLDTGDGRAEANVVTTDTYPDGEVKVENKTYKATKSVILNKLKELKE